MRRDWHAGLIVACKGCCGSEHREGIVVANSDGSTRMVSEVTAPAELVDMATLGEVPVEVE